MQLVQDLSMTGQALQKKKEKLIIDTFRILIDS